MVEPNQQASQSQQLKVTEFVAQQIESHFSGGFDKVRYTPKRFFSTTTNEKFARQWSAGSSTKHAIGTGRIPDTVIRIRNGITHGILTRPFSDLKHEFEVISGASQLNLVYEGVQIDEKTNTIYIDMWDMEKME